MPDFRIIPSIDTLQQRPAVRRLEERFGSAVTTDALRAAAAALRASMAAAASGERPRDSEAAAGWIEARAGAELARTFAGTLRPVLNATGVIVHTNLGRAPLSETALRRVQELGHGYCNLEYDLVDGRRGSRSVHADRLLTTLTGAEAAVVVNNNAAATMLILAALADGREVVVSRGELVEIGGGFRVPDVMAQSGAVLREVGTTNRTRIADYRAAISPRTALLMRIHPSNFRVEGFTERPTLDALVQIGRDAGLPVVEDLGSGSLIAEWAWEPAVAGSVAAGADLVCFSGDKLLGGPQAGLIVGRRALVDRLSKHPLMRALRVDKLTLAALEGTLLDYLARRTRQVPVVRMIETAPEEIEGRAQTLAGHLHEGGWKVALVSGASTIGGGSAPGLELPTVLVAVERPGLSANALESRLRALDPPVIARIDHDRVVLDLRTIFEADDERLLSALLSVVE